MLDNTGALPPKPSRSSKSRGKVSPAPVKQALHQAQAGSLEPKWPAIYFIDGKPGPQEFARAARMGFNRVGLAAAAEAAEAAAAAGEGLALVLDLDLTRADPQSPLLAAHPAWFAPSPEGPRFVYAGEPDALLDWWDAQLAALQESGVNEFRCLNIAEVPAGVWQGLIERAKTRHPASMFHAWTPGVPEPALRRLAAAGFDFSFSSSCWWDFRAGWLNDDAARMAVIGPAIALAAAPHTAWVADEAARRRAVVFAASYAAGWLMPAGFEAHADFDLSEEIAALNRLRASRPDFFAGVTAQVVSSAGAAAAILRRGAETAIILNASSAPAPLPPDLVAPALGGALKPIDGAPVLPDVAEIPPAFASICEIVSEKPIILPKHLPADCDAPRLAIEAVTPCVDDGTFPVRRIAGEVVIVEADLIGDGHDKLAADVMWRAADETKWRAAPMALVANDRWRGRFTLERLGRYVFAIAAWKDFYASFVDEVTKKHNAGVPVELELQEGVLLVQDAVKANTSKATKALKALLKSLDGADLATRRAALLSAETVSLMREADPKRFEVRSGEIIVDAERMAARFASWYEIFPRSQSGDPNRHGTLQDVISQLPRIAGMGFDVLYFPPIHPIGKKNRKGKNNTLTPAPDDPGSPYAIGSDEGGHDAVHPELGTLDDFRALCAAARQHGMELALDFAIQCAPDHPWLKEHKDWFDWRPDGTIKYAENPPKKYEDIVNVDFYTEGAKPALWKALRDIVEFWVEQGVRLFRVDNPHTKPFPFWEWMIADIRGRHPDTVFLAEAFTRPKVMYRLAKIGFSQSYTYFTWRNTKAEFTEYLNELNQPPQRDYFRPHFFVNTPDINPVFLQNSGRAGFLIRAALAATLSGLWGVYNGFELCEATPLTPGKEEYLDSEKYQIRVWDYDRPGNIVPEITRLNAIRRRNAALQTHLGVTFHAASDETVLYFSKTAADGNVILAAICLDPFGTHDCAIEIPLWLFGLPDDGALRAEDLMRDFDFVWHGKYQRVTLHPASPFCIWRISPAGA